MITKDQVERLIAALEIIGQNMGKTNLAAAQSTPTPKLKRGRHRKIDVQSQFKTHFLKKYSK